MVSEQAREQTGQVQSRDNPMTAYRALIYAGLEIPGINGDYPRPFCESHNCSLYLDFIRSPKTTRGEKPKCNGECGFNGDYFHSWLEKHRLKVVEKRIPQP